MKQYTQVFIEKVISDPTAKPYGTRVVKGEYEPQRPPLLLSNHSGWGSVDEFRKQRTKKRRDFLGETKPGVFKFDLGTHYGIHSFQLVWFAD